MLIAKPNVCSNDFAINHPERWSGMEQPARSKANHLPFKVDFTTFLQLSQICSPQCLLDDVKAECVMILPCDLRTQTCSVPFFLAQSTAWQ